jgi:multicomponent Na+:H+ antiporter subunit E
MMRFVPYFILQSLRGGFDVAFRALRPEMPIKPGFIEYRMRYLSPGPAQWFFMNAISLLPGSVSVGFNAGSVTVHALNVADLDAAELRDCEQRVAALFGLEVSDSAIEGFGSQQGRPE